jgi:hypothetical protein
MKKQFSSRGEILKNTDNPNGDCRALGRHVADPLSNRCSSSVDRRIKRINFERWRQ